MARALRGGRCCRKVLTAATRRKQTLWKREGRHSSTIKEPRTTAGGGSAKGLQGGGRKGLQEGERVQDAARCKSWCITYKCPASLSNCFTEADGASSIVITKSTCMSKETAQKTMVTMTKVSDVLCPQLLGEYESLRREHEELKVKKKTYSLY